MKKEEIEEIISRQKTRGTSARDLLNFVARNGFAAFLDGNYATAKLWGDKFDEYQTLAGNEILKEYYNEVAKISGAAKPPAAWQEKMTKGLTESAPPKGMRPR